jgi:hypothetical protein
MGFVASMQQNPIHMKKILLLCLTLSVLITACQKEENLGPKNQKKDFYLKVKGAVDVQSGGVSGRSASADPTYYFLEIYSPTGLYASGVFDALPDSLKVSLLDNTNYTVKAKAIKKGESFGIVGYPQSIPPQINGVNLTNSISYSNPSSLSADYGYAYVYTSADSSTQDFSYYPPTNTFYDNLAFNSGTTNTVDLELARQVFGVETVVIGLTQGEVRVRIGEASYPSIQRVSFPDTTRTNVYSFLYLYNTSNTIPVKVFYNDGTTDQLLYDNALVFNRLEKKKFIITLDGSGTGAGGTGFNISILDEPLYDGEDIVID